VIGFFTLGQMSIDAADISYLYDLKELLLATKQCAVHFLAKAA
jgi:hypothetical protein